MIDQSFVHPAWLTVKEAVRYVGCGRTSLYAAIAASKIEARKAFGRTLVSRASIDAFMADAPRVGTAQAAA